MAYHQVVVGNIGTVYSGLNGFVATQKYNAYIGISKRNEGRASGEPVTWFKDNEIYKEYFGTIHDDYDDPPM